MIPRLVVIAAFALALGAVWPASMGVLLALAGFAAAASCALGAHRLSGTIRMGWVSIAAGEFLNGIGNTVLMLQFEYMINPPSWLTHVLFMAASSATAAGVFSLVLDPGARHLRLIWLDLVAVVTFAFAIALIWNLSRFVSDWEDYTGSWDAPVVFLGIVVSFVALGLGVLAWNSQAAGHWTANRLVVLGVLASALADSGAVAHISVPFAVVSLMWLTSSLLLILAGRFASTTGERERTMTPGALGKLATGLVAVLLVSILLKPSVIGDFRAVFTAVVIVGMSRQLTVVWSQTKLNRDIEVAETMDSLTRLANRVHFERSVAKRIGTAGSATVMSFDIDRFKWINDTNGNPVGDLLLVEVARRLTSLTGDSDVVARFGGNVFAILFGHSLESDAALGIARRIHSEATGSYTIVDGTIFVQASCGLAIQQKGSATTVLRAADLALSAAKSERPGSVWVYDDELERRETARQNEAALLRRALHDDGLTVVYQPIFEIFTSEPVAVEALLRWFDDDGEQILSAGEMFELARAAGFIAELDSWAIERAIQDASTWTAAGQNLAVNVNVSSRKFSEPGFANALAELLAVHSLPGDRLIVELTEHTIFDTHGPALGALNSLCDIGVRFAIDDFGSGYSNLSYLTRLPLYEIKIDRAFIADIETSVEKQSIARAIAGLGHELGLVMCAEGVEREEELTFLRHLGVQLVQGFLLGGAQLLTDLLNVPRTGSVSSGDITTLLPS